MVIIKTRRELQNFSLQKRLEGRSIGLVPTMGALHAGHLSLIDIARKRANIVIVSIFVNPTQFAPTEDLNRYPRPFERDVALCREHCVDVVFAPEPNEMYAENASTFVTENSLSQVLCGASRPVFFRGVTTVVAKLFNLARPNFAVFGLKDAQQALVIERMVRDLDMPVEIIKAPLIRDDDGLALSSRNAYLSPDERMRALSIHKNLLKIRAVIENNGWLAGEAAIAGAEEDIRKNGGRIDYFSLYDCETLELPVDKSTKLILAAAVWFGKTRLIDNEIIEAVKP